MPAPMTGDAGLGECLAISEPTVQVTEPPTNTATPNQWIGWPSFCRPDSASAAAPPKPTTRPAHTASGGRFPPSRNHSSSANQNGVAASSSAVNPDGTPSPAQTPQPSPQKSKT